MINARKFSSPRVISIRNIESACLYIDKFSPLNIFIPALSLCLFLSSKRENNLFPNPTQVAQSAHGTVSSPSYRAVIITTAYPSFNCRYTNYAK